MTASVTRTLSPDESEMRIVLAGRIDATLHLAFSEALRSGPRTGVSYVVDLTHVESIDSTGLGLFFELRTFAGGDSARITLLGGNAQVSAALKLANLYPLFRIQEASSRS